MNTRNRAVDTVSERDVPVHWEAGLNLHTNRRLSDKAATARVRKSVID
jgi:hypothetical protein